MNLIQPGLCALLLAAGAGWTAWLVDGYRPEDIAAIGLGTVVGASFLVYFATDRKDAFLWLRFGLYGGGLAVCLGSFWVGIVRPLQHVRSFGDAMAWLDRLDGPSLVLLVVPGPAVVLLGVIWFEVAVATFRHLGGSGRRRRARVRSSRQGEPAGPAPPAKAGEAERHPPGPVGRRTPRTPHRLAARGLRHHRRAAPCREGGDRRAQPALARRARVRRAPPSP